jgi:hypothetical protein
MMPGASGSLRICQDPWEISGKFPGNFLGNSWFPSLGPRGESRPHLLKVKLPMEKLGISACAQNCRDPEPSLEQPIELGSAENWRVM